MPQVIYAAPKAVLAPVPTPFTDHIYATKHGVPLLLRVWAAQSVTSPSPWALNIHGGAFAQGFGHVLPNPWIVPGFRSKGIHTVSVGYRYTPQVGMDEIIEDVKDAYKWCRANLESAIGIGKVDIDRYILLGDSAGASLATNMVSRLTPMAKVIVPIYGGFNFLNARSKPGAPRSPLDIQPLSGRWSEEEVKRGIEERDPSKAVTLCPFHFDYPDTELARLWGLPDYKYDDKQYFQWEMKKYLRTTNLLMYTLLRHDTFATEEEFEEHAKALSALHILDKDPRFPPTFFLHGEADPVTPLSGAIELAEKLRGLGVPVGESYEPGMVHEFDHKYTGPDVPGWDKYIVPILEFVDHHSKA